VFPLNEKLSDPQSVWRRERFSPLFENRTPSSPTTLSKLSRLKKTKLSHLDFRYHRRSKKKKPSTPSSVRVEKFVFLVLAPCGEFRLSSDVFYHDSSLVQGLIHVSSFNNLITIIIPSLPHMFSRHNA
jgi:hypothetical protein